MYTRVPAEKKPNPSFGGSSANSNKKPLNRQRPAKKPNVRTTDYRILMQWILTNPDSITQEEFMFFQSAVGYQQALRVMEEGRRRKQLQKLGVPTAEANRQPIRTNKQAGENIPSSDGLPENLKTGLENLSGVSLSEVKVHKNSEEPQKVGAQAYTQGDDIHIAPGQEKYLPHEGWHAVQQKQGRVEAETQLKTDAAVNEDSKLEREADVMGARAEREGSENDAIQSPLTSEPKSSKINGKVIQRVMLQEGMELNNTKNPVKEEVGGIKTAGYGETSENVKKIQQVLIRMNYWTGKSGDKATGYFGEVTKESLINFQTGYMKLGKGELYDKKGNYVGCGPSTARSLDSLYKLLNNSNVPEQAKSSIMEIGKNKETNAAYDWDIKAGQYNGYVKEAQLILMSLGYKLLKYGADGKWSSNGETYEAILSYQTNCKNAFSGVDKNGSTEGKKQVGHLHGIEPTGKLDKCTYEVLEKEKSKKAATSSNESPAKKTEKDNKGTGSGREDVEAEALAEQVFRFYYTENRGASPATSANTKVTPEVAIEVLKNLSKGELPWKPELSQNGGAAFFTTEGNPYTGINPTKNFNIDVQIEIPKNALVFNESTLLEIYYRHKNACRIEAEQKFRNFNSIPENPSFTAKQLKAFDKYHHKFAERLMWNEVGATVRKSSVKVGEVILQDSFFSKQGDGKFAVVADASKIQVEGGITRLSELLKERGVAAEPALVEAAEDMARRLKWAGNVRNVFRYGGKVLIVVGVAADVYKVYVAEDKVKAVVESAGGWAGATAGAAAFAAWWTPADVAGPWAWVAHGVGTLIAGGVGYWVGSGITRTIYELVVED